MTKAFEKTIILQGIGRSQDAFPYVSDGITQTEATLRIPDEDALPLLRSRRILTEANLVDDIRIKTLVIEAPYFQPFDGAFAASTVHLSGSSFVFEATLGTRKISFSVPSVEVEDYAVQSGLLPKRERISRMTLDMADNDHRAAVFDRIMRVHQAMGGLKADQLAPHTVAEEIIAETMIWASVNTPGSLDVKMQAVLKAAGDGMGNFVSSSFDAYPEMPTLKVDVTLELFAPTAGVNMRFEKGDLAAEIEFELDREIYDAYVAGEKKKIEPTTAPTP